jgi:hypothetical protein
MKTTEVIRHARERHPNKVRSSLLRWEPSSCSLIMRQGGQWRPAVSIFDGVLVQYCDTNDLTMHRDRDAYRNFINHEGGSRLHLWIRPRLLGGVEKRTPLRTSMLRDVLDYTAPNDDRDMYWHWAFQYMVVTYCHVVRAAASELDSSLNALVTSSSYSQLSQSMETLFKSVSQGSVLNYSTDVSALQVLMDKVSTSLNTARYRLGEAYSDRDNRRYSRPSISARRVCVNGAGDWEIDPYANPAVIIEDPSKLLAHWPDLVKVLASIGIEEPKPYGLTFSDENFAALASLYDVAKLDYAEPQKWRDAAKGTAVQDSVPVSAMEFA